MIGDLKLKEGMQHDVFAGRVAVKVIYLRLLRVDTSGEIRDCHAIGYFDIRLTMHYWVKTITINTKCYR